MSIFYAVANVSYSALGETELVTFEMKTKTQRRQKIYFIGKWAGKYKRDRFLTKNRSYIKTLTSTEKTHECKCALI